MKPLTRSQCIVRGAPQHREGLANRLLGHVGIVEARRNLARLAAFILIAPIGLWNQAIAQEWPEGLNRQAERALRGLLANQGAQPSRPPAPSSPQPSNSRPSQVSPDLAATTGAAGNSPQSAQPNVAVGAASAAKANAPVASAADEELAPSGLLMRKKTDWNSVAVLLPGNVDLRTYLSTGTIRRDALPYPELETYFREVDNYSCRYYTRKVNKPDRCNEMRAQAPSDLGWRWFCIWERAKWNRGYDPDLKACAIVIEGTDGKSFKVTNNLTADAQRAAEAAEAKKRADADREARAIEDRRRAEQAEQQRRTLEKQRQDQVMAARQAKEARLVQFQKKHNITEFAPAEQILNNPFAFEGKNVMLWAGFQQMESATTAIFFNERVFMVVDVPRGAFTSREPVILAAKVLGNVRYDGVVDGVMQIRGMVPKLKYLGALRCVDPKCEILTEK